MEKIEKTKMNLEGKFWTKKDEMIEELESLDYSVTYSGYEYFVVTDDLDEDDTEYKILLGHAGATMWVKDVEEI